MFENLLWHNTDTAPAQEAANRHRGKAYTHRQQVINVLMNENRLTACEIGDRSGLGHIEAQRRLSDLLRNGKVLKGKPRKCGIKGVLMSEWHLLEV